MSHEIEFVDNKPSIAYAGAPCWHGLGVNVPSDLTPLQMLEAANLNWTVTKIPAHAIGAGEKKEVGWSALVRSTDNKIIDIVSDDWNPVQNHEAFAEAVVTLLENSELNLTFGKQARRKVEAQFSNEVIAFQHELYYQKIIASC
jgi:glycosyltransferase involved in cell wall biosynthesis